MRCPTFTLTYLAFLCVAAMRASFSFVQYDLALYLRTDSKYLGIISTFSNIIIGFGFFFRALFPFKRLIHQYFISSCLVAFFLLLIPLSLMLEINSLILIGIFYIFFGWFQGGLYPALIALMNKKFTAAQDGFIIGFWSSTNDIGGISGFLICTLLIYYAHVSWLYCLIFISLLSFLINGLFKIILQDGVVEEQENLEFSEKMEAFKNFFRNSDQLFIFCILFSVGATQFGVLLWLPLYLQELGFKEFQGYISVSYGISSLIGSSLNGFMYQKIVDRKGHLAVHICQLCIALITLIIIYYHNFQEKDKWILLILLSIIGFCVGAIFNAYVSIESMISSEQNWQNVQVNNGIICGGLHIWVGLTQIIIGFENAKNPNSLFIIFIVFVLMTIIFIVIRLIFKFKRELLYQQQREEEL